MSVLNQLVPALAAVGLGQITVMTDMHSYR